MDTPDPYTMEVGDLCDKLAVQLLEQDPCIAASALCYLLSCNIAAGIIAGELKAETVVDTISEVVRQAVKDRMAQLNVEDTKDGGSIHH